MMRRSAALSLAMLAVAVLPAPAQVTDLTQRATSLTGGMDKCAVHALLGRPTWVIGVGENPETADLGVSEWLWDNGVCNPVAVMFDEPAGLVSGWDEGAAFCAQNADERPFQPAERFRLSAGALLGCE